MTKLLYRDNPDTFQSCVQILEHGHDAKGLYVVFDQSLFYPQGGGQPADQGQIITNNTCYDVLDVRHVDGQVRHYLNSDEIRFDVGDNVSIKIDQARRLLNSKYHTSGHLIASVVEQENPLLQAVKGHQFPGQAYVEFIGVVDDAGGFLSQLQAQLSRWLASKAVVETKDLSATDAAIIAKQLPYTLPQKQSMSVCHIAGFPPVPCGGTHVGSLEAIASLTLKQCKSKQGKTKIHYEVK